MRFGILGAVEAWDPDGAPVALGGPRVRALLALLLLSPGRVVATESLVDGLYGDNPPGDASGALQAQVSRLRRALRTTGAVVEFHPAGYRVAVEADDVDEVDAHRFRRLAASGSRALAEGDAATASRLLNEALELWRGPALADVADLPFAPAAATALEEDRVAALTDRIEADLALGGHDAVLADLRALTATHPLRERPRAQLVRALHAAGRHADALAAFEEARRLLADELGADPSPELAAAHLAVLRGEVSSPPEPAAPVTHRAELPAQLTSFVGRDAELARIHGLVATSRLVTLTGPGGTGKTRLAVEAAAREGDAVFVDLAPLGEGSQVSRAIASALGLREAVLMPGTGSRPGADPVARIAEALADNPPLIVVDNCEHLVDETARVLHRLLGACPALHVVATSREPLGITGETLCPVPRLDLPPEDSTPADALAYPGVRLFVDRATAVRPAFVLDDTTTPDVLRICAALDGLPLAIELAASRLRALPLDEVAARLGDRFRLLSRGERTAAPRHRTLRGVVEWSWDLLGPDEQRLARRLTVFAGGATTDAVARVCGADGDLLADLADKSLIELAETPTGVRHRMLDTIRAFCAERLAEAGEEEALRAAHAAYYLDLAAAAEPHLRSAQQLDALARLGAEHPNFLAALRRTVTTDPLTAMRLIAEVSWYGWLRGMHGDFAALARETLAILGHTAPDGLSEEYVLCALTASAHGQPDPETETDLRNASRIMFALDAPPRRPYLHTMAAMLIGPGTYDDHEWPPPESVQAFTRRIGDDPWSQAVFRMGLGFTRAFTGDVVGAEGEFEAALAGFREIGDRWAMANALDPLAEIVDWRGDRARFAALINEAVGLLGELGAGQEIAAMLCRRGEGMLRGGDVEAARADFVQAMDLARRMGASDSLGQAWRGLGEIARLGGDPGEARRLLDRALALTGTGMFGEGWTHAQVLVSLARLAEGDGDAAAAASLAHQAVETALTSGSLPRAAEGIEALAGAAVLGGDGVRAALLLGAGAAVRGATVAGDPDVARVAAAARARVGDAAFDEAYAQGRAMAPKDALTVLG